MKIYTNAELRKMTPDELNAHIDALLDETERLHAKRKAATQAPTSPTAPEPVAVAPVTKLPRKARKAVERFDNLTDGEQIAELRKVGW